MRPQQRWQALQATPSSMPIAARSLCSPMVPALRGSNTQSRSPQRGRAWRAAGLKFPAGRTLRALPRVNGGLIRAERAVCSYRQASHSSRNTVVHPLSPAPVPLGHRAW